jgi:hypothetical protein
MLRRSKDRKVAADVTASGGIRIANAFGLPAGQNNSCPGATSICEKVCYAGKLETIYKGVRNVVLDNFVQLRDTDFHGQVRLLDEMITEFVAECDKKNGTKKFRIHWDGDFFSLDYARAWAVVIERHPDVQFWVYTRSFIPAINVVPILAGIPNLALYLSVDRDNLEYAKAVRKEYRTVRWAFLGESNESTKRDMLSMNDRPGAICPENVKRIELITPDGGACISCDLCVMGKADVRFAVTKK